MTDLKKWFPFKFNRNTQTETGKSTGKTTDEHGIARRVQLDDPFVRMERQMDQLMGSLLGGNHNDWFLPQMRASGSSSWFGDYSPQRFSPSIDVTNHSSHLVVAAELPGMTKSDVEVTVQDGALMLKGQKQHAFQSDEDGCFRTERFYGSFQRTIPLPADVDPNGAEAQFENGVLVVKLPKVEIDATGPRRIELG